MAARGAKTGKTVIRAGRWLVRGERVPCTVAVAAARLEARLIGRAREVVVVWPLEIQPVTERGDVAVAT